MNKLHPNLQWVRKRNVTVFILKGLLKTLEKYVKSGILQTGLVPSEIDVLRQTIKPLEKVINKWKRNNEASKSLFTQFLNFKVKK